MATSTFTKSIEMQFERDGKRTRFVGFIGQLVDESGVVLHSQSYATKPEAERALDALAHELLIDYAERGLVDELPEPAPERVTTRHYGTGVVIGVAQDNDQDVLVKLDTTTSFGAQTVWQSRSELTVEDAALTTAQKLAQALANTTKVPTYVVAQDSRYLIQDDADIDCYGGRADIVASYQSQVIGPPPFEDPLPSDAPGDNDSIPGDERPRSVSLQSLAIESRIVTCAYCRGIHHIQKCPQLRHAVFVASWIGVDLGRGLCQLRWRNHDGFTQLLANATPARLVEYAESYVAFIRENRPESSLTTHEVLDRWLPLIGGDPGPAAPAMQVAA
jgi:hypothetical protein